MHERQELVIDDVTYVINELNMDKGLKLFENVAQDPDLTFNAALMRASVEVDGIPITEIPFRHVMQLLPVVMRVNGLGKSDGGTEGNE